MLVNGVWAVNICGYKERTVYPDEWVVFGAHFDIAPSAAYTPGPDIPEYGCDSYQLCQLGYGGNELARKLGIILIYRARSRPGCY